MNSKKIFKSGFVGLVGRTNVGKSTLINKILKKKVVITSNKVQTTRNRINCILNGRDHQIIFVDGPGFFKPRNLLQEKLKKVVTGVISDVDIITAVVDIASGIGPGDMFTFNSIKDRPQPKILLLNKTDLVSKKEIEREREKIRDLDFFKAVIEISAKTGKNLDRFLNILVSILPEGPKYFEDDMITDQPVEMAISEIVREKLVKNLSDELPHSIVVEVERFEEKATKAGEKLLIIGCSIFTERNSQKAIIIGKGGKMLKKVGAEARKELEQLLESKVFLELWVKVRENWTRKEPLLSRFGF